MWGFNWLFPFKPKCNHVFEIIESATILNKSNKMVGRQYTMRCLSCGKIEFKKWTV